MKKNKTKRRRGGMGRKRQREWWRVPKGGHWDRPLRDISALEILLAGFGLGIVNVPPDRRG